MRIRAVVARGNTIAFSLFKTQWTRLHEISKGTVLSKHHQERIEIEKVIFSVGWHGYDGRVDLDCQKIFVLSKTTMKASGPVQKLGLYNLVTYKTTRFIFI